MQKILSVLALIYTLFIGCNTVDPPENVDNTPPGKRNYTWNVDSVDYGDLPGFIQLYSIWGSSPDDVWGAGFTEDVRNCLWHYDGEKWSRAVWNTPITEFGNGSKSVGGVWGTAQNDVWAFGGRLFSKPDRAEPFIMHFDGNKWAEIAGDKNQMPVGYTDIYAIDKDHFWISSSDHVSEYNNGIWKKYFVSEGYYIQSIGGNGKVVYLTAYPIGANSVYLMRLEGDSFVVVDSTSLFEEGKFGYSGLLFAGQKVFTFGNGIFSSQLEGEMLVNWTKEVGLSNGGFANSFLNHTKDIWAIGINSLPYHFAGTDWIPINIYLGNNFSMNTHLRDIWGNGEEIFIADIENRKIYHGK